MLTLFPNCCCSLSMYMIVSSSFELTIIPKILCWNSRRLHLLLPFGGSIYGQRSWVVIIRPSLFDIVSLLLVALLGPSCLMRPKLLKPCLKLSIASRMPILLMMKRTSWYWQRKILQLVRRRIIAVAMDSSLLTASITFSTSDSVFVVPGDAMISESVS